ncbi:hypothetical protein Sar04_48950 [Salinispora arenicola]|uniref:Uncharacterized protein n=1 Tax=Salinispora arenicola TaxID=168697 RepID=A0ABQ4JZ23_SALAC|nr:hypothetical protein Sar04_48950 [Salinispora arenicola]
MEAQAPGVRPRHGPFPDGAPSQPRQSRPEEILPGPLRRAGTRHTPLVRPCGPRISPTRSRKHKIDEAEMRG